MGPGCRIATHMRFAPSETKPPSLVLIAALSALRLLPATSEGAPGRGACLSCLQRQVAEITFSGFAVMPPYDHPVGSARLQLCSCVREEFIYSKYLSL